MISFVFTWLIMGIFLLFSYTSSSTVISGHLFLFTTLFYFIFLLPVFSILRGEDMRTMSRGLVFVIITNNFIFLLLLQALPFQNPSLLNFEIIIHPFFYLVQFSFYLPKTIIQPTQIIEKTSTLETKQQKETVPEKKKPVVETVIRGTGRNT